MTEQQVTYWYGYREGTEAETRRCIALRSKVAECARALAEHVPPGPDQDYCQRKLKEALQAMIGAVVAPYPQPNIPGR